MRNNSAIDLIFEQSRKGRWGVQFPASDVPEQALADLIPADQLAASAPKLPELTEPDVVRHFMNLAMLNMSVDTHYYPLGSCTMKYNPRRNETLIATQKLAGLHPYQPESKETLDCFADALVEIINTDAELLHDAPRSTAISRPDEVAAVRKPVLRYSVSAAEIDR